MHKVVIRKVVRVNVLGGMICQVRRRTMGLRAVKFRLYLHVLDPPPQYSDRGPKGGHSNDGLAYGQDNQGHSSKDKSGSSHTVRGYLPKCSCTVC